MSVSTKKIYLEDHAFVELRAELIRAGCTLAEFQQADGSLKLYSDNGSGNHFDVVTIEKLSKK